MSDQKGLIVGFDLCDDYSQISYFNNRTFEPESIFLEDDEEKYLIPTALGVKKDSYDWCFGDEAITLSKKEEAVLVDHILVNIKEKKEITVFDTKFTGEDLLEKFFRKSLTLLKKKYPNETIDQLMITLKELDMNVIRSVYGALERLGLKKDRVSIQSHEQSYLYYALSQKKELWMNDVGLFDFDESGLHYYQITINRRNQPNVVLVSEKDCSDTLSYDLFQEFEFNEHLAYIFENIAKNILHKQIVSTLYFTGKGFEGQWADEVMKELCVGRRIFKGQNLYTKGACYAARALNEPERFEDFLFLSNEMITSTIGLKAYCNAKNVELPLAKVASPWYDVDKRLEFILDEEEEIEIVTRNIGKKEPIRQMIALEGLPNRPNKMTRVEVRAKFVDRNTCVITVKDQGFGEFYPSTNRIWEKVITI